MPVPETDFRDFLDEVDELARFAPEIIATVEADLDVRAREKKILRLADKEFFASQTSDLPGLDVEEQEILAEELELAIGRPRMSAYMVYVFVMIRGFLGGTLASKPSRRFLHESMSLYGFLQNRGRKMPGITTILENVNVVSDATRDLLFNKQIEFVLKANLDDFKKLTIDSTSVKANSRWPTDARILTGLLMRANRLGQQLHIYGLAASHPAWVTRWYTVINQSACQLCLLETTPRSRGKLKKHYRQLLKRGRKAANYLAAELKRQDFSIEALPPSRCVLFRRLIQQIKSDVLDGNRVIQYANNRVFNGKVLPSTEKVLSLSDGSAAYIKKGSHNAVIGYKPQLVRSEHGFVTNLLVPQRNVPY